MDQTLDTKGANHALLQEITTEDSDGFHNFLRMDKADFYKLLTKVTPLIQFVFFFINTCLLQMRFIYFYLNLIS